MKTFTVTFHHGSNYGALLQAYALQRVQEDMGISNTVFEYAYPKTADKSRSAKAAAASLYTGFLNALHKKAITRRRESFRRFHEERMRLSRVYHSMDELRGDDIDADVLIAGSDQVWRFSGNPEFLPARFLDFGRPGIKKISYAASIEKLNYTDEQKNKVRGWLRDFSAISLREENAREYICGITGREAERVLDPVFLPGREAWEELAAEPGINEPYILCYQVQRCERMQEIVDTLKKRTGFKTVAVLPASVKYIRTDESRFDVSPEEFLGLYKNASAVVTGSFHGTAFGLIFGKPCFAAARPSGSSRIRGLMQLFGSERFFIDADKSVPEADEWDHSGILSKIESDRES